MDEEIAVERILETENLTDGLEDDDAKWLREWGIDQVHGLIAGIEDDDLAHTKLSELMAVMRRLNQIVADRSVLPINSLVEHIHDFSRLYEKAFGQVRKLTGGDYTRAANAIREQSPGEALKSLIDLVAPHTPATRWVPGDPDGPKSSYQV